MAQRRTLRITDRQRSAIASVLVAGASCETAAHTCLCCGDDAIPLCAEIVGPRHAEALRTFAYESLGCGWSIDGRGEAEWVDIMEQHYLDKVSQLEVLYA
jgi:hypothetical protein